MTNLLQMNSGESDDYDINADSFIITKDGSRYNLNWAIGDSEDSADMDSYASYISSNDGYVRVVMTFPQKPISHNATSVSMMERRSHGILLHVRMILMLNLSWVDSIHSGSF